LVEKSCRNCHLISEESVCPNCKSKEFSEDFTGLVIVVEPETSAISKVLNIKKKGRYAIRIR
jgi:DNA-directed RNA polymerase subunit E"